MRVRVLGSAAGGGFPQWNCACQNCRGVREGRLSAEPRTQDCVSVEAGGHRWLLNASPEIRQQLLVASLFPRAPRQAPVAGIFLTNADLDHCLGLLSLREGTRLELYTTRAIRESFVEGNVLYRALQRFPGHVTWHDLPLGREQEVPVQGAASGLLVTAIEAPGKPPLYREGLRAGEPGDNVALWLRDARSGRQLLYAPGVAYLNTALLTALASADAVLFDGTFWSSTELPDLGLGTRRAEDMAHLPIGGPEGSLRLVQAPRARHRIYTHVNNTNPVLVDDSRERASVRAAGWEVAFDGLEIEL